MSLGIALSNAVSGLRLNQKALSVLSNNMANVNTEGYSRKIMNQTAVTIEGVGNGVKIDSIVRKVDTYLQRSVMNQGSVTQSTAVVNSYYDRLQVLLGAPGSENSIDEYMTTFFNTMQQMADQPDRTSYRSNMINSATILADQVSGLAYQMESLRFQADSDISGSITEVNTALKKLYDLNGALARASAMGQSTAGLLDERDMALKTLANNMDISTYYEQNGTVTVTAGSGVPLVDGILHKLQYSPAPSVDNLVDNQRLNAIEVIAVDTNGNQSGVASTLVSGGKLGEITSVLKSGKIQGLVELRDTLMPDILNQLDMLASRLRDSMNGLHNNGTGWPIASSLTGSRDTYASAESDWTGSVRISVLGSNGQPIASQYADENYTGIRPLTLDLSTVRSGSQSGKASVQTLIDEINAHFGAPTTKAQLGNLNNIELVSNTPQLPSGGTSLFNFDLELDNISRLNSSVFVTGVSVRDNTNAVLPGAYTQGPPTLALDGTNTFQTYAGKNYVDVGVLSTADLKVGDRIYLGPPAVATANGITATQLTGYFTITEKTGSTVRIDTAGTASADGVVNDASGLKLQPAYAISQAGEKARTYTGGELQVDLTGNINAAFYDITVDVGVMDANGIVTTSQITYRVANNKENLYNDRYFANAATGNGSLEAPLSTQAALRAIMVDETGKELPKVDGKYIDLPGYMKIVGGSSDYVVAIDEMDSQQMGNVVNNVPASGWGFSHYFGLNDFFDANDPIDGGDTLRNSAINLKVSQRLIDNPNLVSSGRLTLQTQPADTSKPAQYTYVRYSGDNSAAQAMAALADIPIGFEAAGGLPTTALSLQAYTSEMLGYLSSISQASSDNAENAQLLYDAFEERNKAISSVNLDEELANTIVFQNSYAASARIVTVVNEMFKTLIDAA